MDFIAEILQEAEVRNEERKLELDRLRADATLAAIKIVERQMGDVKELCDQESKLIEEYRSRELERLDKKRIWLVFNLEGWARSTGEKTIRLIHGLCKIRKGRDKVVVVASDKFMKVGPGLNLVRFVPEQMVPDLRAIAEYVHRTGEIPPGIEFVEAKTNFSYIINGGPDGDDKREEAET